MKSEFKHIDLRIVYPNLQDDISDLIIDLEHLRKRELYGSTKPFIFFQLKNIFHMLESFGSARIEGNNSTLADVIETKIERKNPLTPNLLEITNMENAMSFIDEQIASNRIDRAFVGEIHKYVVKDLPLQSDGGEGDRTPGVYRIEDISIKGSGHKPCTATAIDAYMDELFDFINHKDPPKVDLLKTAISHHRFMWIHPFGNGNGRTGRLLTYAMLVKQGFSVNKGRIINPTAIFCSDRNSYYSYLSRADSGSDKCLLDWCTYVLTGLKKELEKIDKLLNYEYLREQIIIPALADSLKGKLITENEWRILGVSISKAEQCFKANDIKSILNRKHASEVSMVIRELLNKKMLAPLKTGGRIYHIKFDNNYLLRSIMRLLEENGFTY